MKCTDDHTENTDDHTDDTVLLYSNEKHQSNVNSAGIHSVENAWSQFCSVLVFVLESLFQLKNTKNTWFDTIRLRNFF